MLLLVAMACARLRSAARADASAGGVLRLVVVRRLMLLLTLNVSPQSGRWPLTMRRIVFS